MNVILTPAQYAALRSNDAVVQRLVLALEVGKPGVVQTFIASLNLGKH